ncbi:hypothetical protein Zmor_024573 [Zophobas morio]|uniref:Uncharacterized protein n=1 Tax=Zophobas morio TaxID=2755281 RepID=A0AA38HYR6_9CUCU|nr:hypothetical protein Zmor_024573 [Zophobas morio]
MCNLTDKLPALAITSVQILSSDISQRVHKHPIFQKNYGLRGFFVSSVKHEKGLMKETWSQQSLDDHFFVPKNEVFL